MQRKLSDRTEYTNYIQRRRKEIKDNFMAICTKYLEFSYINNHKERLIDQMAQEFLDEINKSNFFTSISYIIKELAGNANKANLKRIFFEDKGLDITSVNVYNENIDNFKNYLSRYAEQYWKTAEQQGYNIRVILSLSLKALTISITNNRNLLPIELERIRKKLNASKWHENQLHYPLN